MLLKQNFIFIQSKQQFGNKEHFPVLSETERDTETNVSNILIDACSPGDFMLVTFFLADHNSNIVILVMWQTVGYICKNM